VLLTSAALLGGACSWLDAGRPTTDASVFTTAHRTTAGAVRDFFGVRPAAEQPIPFPHAIHISKGLTCTDYCHESATKGPIAGLTSVKTCMICHDAIANDRPVIQKLADYHKRGVDLSWQRVYGYTAEAHVKFNHAPHIRAGVECSTCHGDVAQQTVAQRVVDMNMGFCVNCHRTRQVSNDCLTCHF
jgi:Cytochrome c7 and related cytochrome c